MSRKIFYLMLLANIFSPIYLTFGQAINEPKTHAVIIGISKYLDNNIQGLKYAAKDASDFYNFLTSAKGGSVPSNEITILLDSVATRKAIIKAMRERFENAGPNDVILFFYSGHGRVGSNGAGFFATFDTEDAEIDGTALSMSALESYLSRSSRVKYTFIDACHAGLQAKKSQKKDIKNVTNLDNNKLSNSLKAYMDQTSGSYISMLSSQDSQESREYEALRNGVFTHYLIKGLEGEADKVLKNTTNYNDGKITARELSKYLEQRVSEYTKEDQIPYFSGGYSAPEVVSFSNKKNVSSSVPNIDDSYNEILEEKRYPYNKGHAHRQNTSTFEFECPTDTTSKFIDLRLTLFEPLFAEKIEHIKIGIYKHDAKNNTLTFISETNYRARPGLNKFRVRNYLLQKNHVLQIGYFLKSEMNREYPTWVRETCYSSAK